MTAEESNSQSQMAEEEKERYRLLFDHAPDAIFLHDLKGNIDEVNQAACERLGWTHYQLTHMNLAELETDEAPGKLSDQMQRLNNYGALVFLTEHHHSDGLAIPTEINSRIVDCGGKRLAVSIARDMTEYVRVQEALKVSLANVEQLVAARTHELSETNTQLLREVEGRKRFVQKLQGSEKKYRKLVETTDTGFCIVSERGEVLDANSKYVELSGHTHIEDIKGCKVTDWTAKHDHERSVAAVEACYQEGSVRDFQVDYTLPGGGFRPVEINAAIVDILGQKYIHALCRDITARREAEKKIMTLSRAVEQSPASVVITDPGGRIEYVNFKFTEVTGYSAEEAIGRRSNMLKSGEMTSEFYREMWQAISSGKEWRGEFCNKSKSGKVFWESASISPIFDNAGIIVHYVAVKEDITEQREQQERIRRLALHDALTGLANRTLLMDRLTQAIARSARTGLRTALLFIDLNKFKPINDNYGHQTGDAVLRDVAKRIFESVREVDTAARVGGDEFVALLQDVRDLKEVDAVARRLLDAIDQPYDDCAGGACVALGAAIGIALCPDNGKDVDTLIKRADQAMYRVKKTGRSDFLYWEE